MHVRSWCLSICKTSICSMAWLKIICLLNMLLIMMVWTFNSLDCHKKNPLFSPHCSVCFAGCTRRSMTSMSTSPRGRRKRRWDWRWWTESRESSTTCGPVLRYTSPPTPKKLYFFVLFLGLILIAGCDRPNFFSASLMIRMRIALSCLLENLGYNGEAT